MALVVAFAFVAGAAGHYLYRGYGSEGNQAAQLKLAREVAQEKQIYSTHSFWFWTKLILPLSVLFCIALIVRYIYGPVLKTVIIGAIGSLSGVQLAILVFVAVFVAVWYFWSLVNHLWKMSESQEKIQQLMPVQSVGNVSGGTVFTLLHLTMNTGFVCNTGSTAIAVIVVFMLLFYYIS